MHFYKKRANYAKYAKQKKNRLKLIVLENELLYTTLPMF